jgi:hypothetical protein
MTVSVQISVNGNYKLPVTYKQGDREENFTISGRGHNGPNVRHIPFYHSADVMTLQLGPESPDNGEDDGS